MADASNIKDLIRQAMQKQAASVNSERSDENEADVKDGVPASVDSQTAADAVGRMEKDPAVTIGTKAEASTDKDVIDVPKDSNDDQAFKSASDLRKLAANFISQLTKAAEETAITVMEPETVSPDAEGKDEIVPDTVASDDAAVEDKSAEQDAPTTVETGDEGVKEAGVLARQLYKLANALLTADEAELRKAAGVEEGTDETLTEDEIADLSDGEASELSAALQASAEDAAAEGTEDADNTADYLSAYQAMPGMVDGSESPEDPEQLDQILAMLEEAGIGPDEIIAAVQEQAAAPAEVPAEPEVPVEVPVKEASAGWNKLSKTQRRDVVIDVLKHLKG